MEIEEHVMLSLRFPKKLVEDVDKYSERLAKYISVPNVSRVNSIISLLNQALKDDRICLRDKDQ